MGGRHRNRLGAKSKKVNQLINTMNKYRCPVCGYIYDPETGDEQNGVDPGTAFEDLPAEWACPVCGAPPDDFTEVE